MGGFQATNLTSPPPQPEDVTRQQGLSGISSMLAKKLGNKEGSPEDMESASSVHPQGAILALLETIKKATNQLSKMDPGMAPFVNRGMSIIEQGVGEVISKKKPSASPDLGAGGGEGSTRPPSGEMSKGFPG
jgi:hypothetical protein